jgi:hypothetical protein
VPTHSPTAQFIRTRQPTCSPSANATQSDDFFASVGARDHANTQAFFVPTTLAVLGITAVLLGFFVAIHRYPSLRRAIRDAVVAVATAAKRYQRRATRALDRRRGGGAAGAGGNTRGGGMADGSPGADDAAAEGNVLLRGLAHARSSRRRARRRAFSAGGEEESGEGEDEVHTHRAEQSPFSRVEWY